MEVGWFASIIVLVVFLSILFSYLLLRTYVDKRESSYLTSFVSCATVSVTLLCCFLIPVDIYTVSSDLDSTGQHTNPDLVKQSAQAVQGLYYSLYIVLLVFAFILLPFTYFYFEEDAEDATVASRTCAALKWTAGFVFFFFILLTLGLVLKKGSDSSSPDWKEKLKGDFDNGEAVLNFCVGCLACIGLIFYVVYAGYGLSRLPLKIMSRARSAHEANKKKGIDAKTGLLSDEDLELGIRRNKENMVYLESQYQLSGRQWSKEDKQQLDILKKEQRKLESMRQARLIKSNNKAALQGGLSQCDRCWNAVAPLRYLLAIPLFCVSLLIVISLTMTVVDKFMHSDCKASCGYAITKASILNPIDEALKWMSKAFPIDVIVFGALVMYIFLACVSGIVGLGVRFFVFKLYNVSSGRTLPNAYLMASWILSFMVLVLNMQVTNLMPQYALFGTQFYLDANGSKQPCNLDLSLLADGKFCALTQIGKFITTMSVQTPFFNVVLFFGNLGFLFFFLIYLVWGLIKGERAGGGSGIDEWNVLNDDSD